MSESPLVREEFAAWLASLSADAPAGTRGACPLRGYLRAQGHRDARVAPLACWTSEHRYQWRGPILLPRWARDFLAWADAKTARPWADLTAGACLQALQEIEP